MSRVLVVSSDRTGPGGLAINIGDCLLSDALADRFREAGHEVAIADFGTPARADGSRTMLGGLGDLAREIRRSDQVLVGGGTILQDDTPDKRFGGLPRLCLAVALAAAAARVPVTYVAVGCDPVANRVQRFALRAAVRLAREVWVRDARSQVRVGDALHRRAELGADAALLLHGRLPASPPDSDRHGCVVALNRVDARALDAGVVAALAARYGRVTFLSMDQGADADTASLPPATADAFDALTSGLSVTEAVEVCANAQLLIASRMHAMYIAALVGTPMVAIGHSTKVAAFADEFGIPITEVVTADLTGVVADAPTVDKAAARAVHSVESILDRLDPAGRR